MASAARRSAAPASATASGAASATMRAHSDLLLKVAQHHPTVKSALIPGVANESLPVQNVGVGHAVSPSAAARAMKAESEGSRGALAGGDHDSAVAQPRIDRWQFNAHSSQFVVRSWQSYAQGYRCQGWLPGMAAIGSLRTENLRTVNCYFRWSVHRLYTGVYANSRCQRPSCRCRRRRMPFQPEARGARPSAPAFKVYKLRGKVVSTNPATGEVTVDHEAIPGFMDAMTMPYKLKDPSILSELHPGDTITADVLVSQNPDADILLDHIVVIAQGKPDYKPTVFYHVPAPGDAVPDFKLRNQDGRAIDLDQFRGKTLLLTFIYTRCPLPNFCPLVTHNFAVIDKQLAANPALYAKTHLLCVSFDPEHDTPARLRAYGAQYIGSDAKTRLRIGILPCRRSPNCGDGEVFRCGHYARRRRHDYAHAFHHADRCAWQGGTVLSRQRVDAGAGGRGREKSSFQLLAFSC